jgi:hypothetical protein
MAEIQQNNQRGGRRHETAQPAHGKAGDVVVSAAS